MSIDLETKKTVKSITEKYKYGFTTKISSDRAPKGLNEDKYLLILRKSDAIIRHETYKVIKATDGILDPTEK